MARRKKDKELDWLDEEQDEIIWVSKSEIKRDAEALKKLGEKLVELSKAKLNKIPLEENLHSAIELAQQAEREARRRQLQYIGKLLRSMDVEPIQKALDKLENKHNQQQAMLRKIERLRDKLILNGDSELTTLLNDYPQADGQYLRNLIRIAQKENKLQKPLKTYREIYKILKELMIAE